MPNIQVKLRRGTTAQHAGFTGAEGEVTVDTDKETLVVHDNATAGGHELRRKDDTIAGSEIDDNAVTSGKISATDTNFNVTAAGKVGIGKVNSGAYQLEVDGDILIEDTGDNNPVAIFSGSSGSVIQLRDSATTGSDNGIYNIASDGGKFEVGSVLDAGGARTTLIRLHPKGTTVIGSVLRLESIDVANLIAAETGFTAAAGMIAYVQDGDSGSPCLAVHDGSSFKRVALGTTISAT
jgi:hypothetical protein